MLRVLADDFKHELLTPNKWNAFRSTPASPRDGIT